MSQSPLTQPSLLVRLRDRGDDRAWSEFVEIYTPLIQRLARQKGLQEADAADLVQEVFGAVARWIDRYDPDPSKGTFRGWLSRIARNQILDALAARRRHPQGVGDSSMRRLLDAQPAPSPEDTALFEAEYRRRAFAWAAERVRDEVSEMAWRVFWMAGVEGTHAKAVAEAVGTTVGTVYHYKSQVMARLRRKVQELDGEPDQGSDSGERP
jgi:RNA polymerase sigma factor (sigma-70 family)